jgi:hypothetical protein
MNDWLAGDDISLVFTQGFLKIGQYRRLGNRLAASTTITAPETAKDSTKLVEIQLTRKHIDFHINILLLDARRKDENLDNLYVIFMRCGILYVMSRNWTSEICVKVKHSLS